MVHIIVTRLKTPIFYLFWYLRRGGSPLCVPTYLLPVGDWRRVGDVVLQGSRFSRTLSFTRQDRLSSPFPMCLLYYRLDVKFPTYPESTYFFPVPLLLRSLSLFADWILVFGKNFLYTLVDFYIRSLIQIFLSLK